MALTAPRLLTDADIAAAAATLAPSVHNTQPWRIVVHDNGLDLYVDRTRHLAVLDPTGREAMISVGCALLNARVSFAASTVARQLAVARFPDAADPDHVAAMAFVPLPATVDEEELARLEPAIAARHSNRRRFDDEPVPMTLVDALVRAAAAEDGVLVPVLTDEHRAALARLTQSADRDQNADPAYRAELRRWTGTGDDRFDGLGAGVVPHVDGHSEDDVPIRDFDTRGDGALPSLTRSSLGQQMFVLTTADDVPAAWLRAGEALQRVLLEVTARGYVASLFTQPVEVDHVRDRLRSELGLGRHPALVIRVGRAAASPATASFPFAGVVFRR